MISTIVYSQKGRIIITATLRATAIAVSDMRGAFNVGDVLVALKLQGITSITAQQAASQLYYDGGCYMALSE